ACCLRLEIRDESVCHYVRRSIYPSKGIKVVQPPCPQKYGYSPKELDTAVQRIYLGGLKTLADNPPY
ncbi:hypothetical protein, partial [Eoetvoesiella caeni]